MGAEREVRCCGILRRQPRAIMQHLQARNRIVPYASVRPPSAVMVSTGGAILFRKYVYAHPVKREANAIDSHVPENHAAAQVHC
jgi:hypothetical protein